MFCTYEKKVAKSVSFPITSSLFVKALVRDSQTNCAKDVAANMFSTFTDSARLFKSAKKAFEYFKN